MKSKQTKGIFFPSRDLKNPLPKLLEMSWGMPKLFPLDKLQVSCFPM